MTPEKRGKLFALHLLCEVGKMEDLLTPSIVENLIYRFKRLNPKLKGTSHYEAYRVKIMATVAAWYKARPEKVKAKDARRRAYKIGALGRFTAEEWQARKVYFNNRCVYCGQKKKNLTADHWIPLSEGGTNFISNIVPACRNCNSKKSNIPGHVYNFQGKVQTVFALTPQRQEVENDK